MSKIPEHLQRAISFDEGYFSVPLQESQEEFVFLPEVLSQQKIVATFDNMPAGGFPKLYWVREGLVAPLQSVASELAKHGLYLHFTYAYRTFEQQKAIYEYYVTKTIHDYPHQPKELILKMAGVYAACNPATAAHMGGAAVDVTLRYEDGSEVDLGAKYLEDSPLSETTSPLISASAKANRQLLLKVMAQFGFANYPFEFWHFSLGDRIAAYIQGQPFAKYGPVVFEPSAGISHFFSNEEQQQTFVVDHLFTTT